MKYGFSFKLIAFKLMSFFMTYLAVKCIQKNIETSK